MEELQKLPMIELKNEETDSALSQGALNYFCVGWPTIKEVLLFVVDTIKSPIWRWAAKLGLNIIDQIHAQVCPVPQPE